VSKAKGLVVLGGLAALAAGCMLFPVVFAAASGVVHADALAEVETTDVRERIVQLLEAEALYRDRVDWAAARQRLRAAGSPEEADSILEQLIARSTGNHGRWIRASTMSTPSGRLQRTAQASQLRRPATQADPGGPAAHRSGTGDPIGWISIPAFKEDSAAAPEVRHQQQLAFAQQLQSQLSAEDQRALCGWIVDLRANQGGNMWPMLLGVAPLLSTRPDGKEMIGAFKVGAAQHDWTLDSGRLLLNGRPRMGLAAAPYVLRHPAPAVAVLFGAHTASSGEMVALAFRGRPATRSFGQHTAGLSTGNTPVRLADGSMLLLTASVSVDRDLKGDGEKLVPDVVVSDSADAEAAARVWLMEQPACKGAAMAPKVSR